MKKLLILDRDGTILAEPPDEQIDSMEKLVFLPRVIGNLQRIAAETDFEFIMITNQDGLGTASFPEADFWPAHNKMLQILENEGIIFSGILIDRSFPQDNAPTRKPGTALLQHYLKGGYDIKNSWVIGDRSSDVQLAQNLSCGSIFIGEKNPNATFCANNWNEIYRFLTKHSRIAEITRKTKETDIHIRLNLDGTGMAEIDTGLGFFDHMLEQIARHSLCDLKIEINGDLQVDEHHTIEDCALALGKAFSEALGTKKGIERYGFVLPMDDVLATVALDFSGRNWLEWNAEFKREKIGEMPTEMFFHFFKSFSDTAKCNLNIKATGVNEHHKIEAIFKAFGKSIRQAISKNPQNMQIPSTKGVL